MKESGVVTTFGKDKDLAASTDPYNGFGWKHIRRLYPIAIADIIGLATAALLSWLVGDSLAITGGKGLELSSIQFGLTIAFAGISAISLWSYRARDLSASNHNAIGFPRIVGAISFASMLTAFVGLLAWSEVYDPRYTVIVWVLSIPMILIGDYLARNPLRFESGFDPSRFKLLIVGNQQNPEDALKLLMPTPNGDGFNGMRPNHNANGTAPGHIPMDVLVLPASELLPQAIDSHANGKGVMVAVQADRYAEIQNMVDAGNIVGSKVPIALYPSPVILRSMSGHNGIYDAQRFSQWYEVGKRWLDLAIGISALIISAPVIAIIALLIKLDSPGSVFFNQIRVGRDGRLFKMYKFRSMRENAEEMREELMDQNEASGHIFKMADDPRITRIGKIIRRLSLDELPQLFNVVQGTMSIVGPRPPLAQEVSEYDKGIYFRRFEAVPGITGLWQVERGEDASFEEMVDLDIKYIDNWSIKMEIGILLKTFPTMLMGRGAY